MKKLGLIVAIIANLDSLALVILSANMKELQPMGIILGVLCWIVTAYVVYLTLDEKH